jgi:hypothetical protein
LRAQREAAGRDEDYEPETLPVIRFTSENQEGPTAPAAKLKCSRCPRTFSKSQGLMNHLKWHTAESQNKLFAPPPPKVLPPVECELCVEGPTVQVRLRIGGWTLDEITAAVAAGERALVERDERRLMEQLRRMRARDKASEEDNTEHRSGSGRRGSFTAKIKLKVRIACHAGA